MAHMWDISPAKPVAISIGDKPRKARKPKPFALQPIKPPKEHDFQAAAIRALRILAPDVMFQSNDNANETPGVLAMAARMFGLRFPKIPPIIYAITNKKKRERGIDPDFPDTAALWNGRTIYFEWKRLGLGKVRPGQQECHGRLRKHGFPVEVCETIDEALAALRRHGFPVRGYFT